MESLLPILIVGCELLSRSVLQCVRIVLLCCSRVKVVALSSLTLTAGNTGGFEI